jgi:cytochrome oxidase Cu insertion factor (SCO1/SenC/PrrC family)
MDHFASVLLFDENGSFVEAISYGTGHDEAVGKVRNLMGLESTS